jgi:hypothetical protein
MRINYDLFYFTWVRLENALTSYKHTHAHTYGRARTFLNKAGSKLYHVFKEVETMKSVSTTVDSQISS